MSGGEQTGKSLSAAMWLLGEMFNFGTRYGHDAAKPAPAEVFWIVGQHYDMTRYVGEHIGPALKANGMLIHQPPSWNPGVIQCAGNQVIRTKSALDPESLMGESPDAIVVDEGAQLSWDGLLRVFARTGPKRARLFIAGTMEGSIGWFPETQKLWEDPYVQQTEDVQSFRVPSWENIHRYPGGRNDPEIKRLENLLPPDVFNERIAAIASPPKGLVHEMFRNNIHAAQPVPFEPDRTVYLGIDPGRSHEGSAYAVVAAHFVKDQDNPDGQIRIFDVVYVHGKTTEDVISICEGKEWWKRGPMVAVIDQAGNQHRTQSALSDADFWAKAGVPCRWEYVPVDEGIRRVNIFLMVNPISRKPRLVIDPKNGVGLIAEWGGAPSPFGGGIKVYRWHQNREGETIGGAPRDQYNDASKALAYMICLNWRYSTRAGDNQTIKIKRYTVSDEADKYSLKR